MEIKACAEIANRLAARSQRRMKDLGEVFCALYSARLLFFAGPWFMW
jgi:hypothetical protein